MSVHSRRDRERAELRRKILETAKEIIAEEGYDALTIRKIAARIEYSPMALYNHFADKAAILLALAHDSFRGLESTMPKPGHDPAATLRKALLAYIAFGLKHPEEYRIAFMTTLPAPTSEQHADGPLQVSNRTGGRQAFETLVGYVQACVDVRIFEGTPFELASALWAGVHGVVSLQITQRGFPFPSRKLYGELVVDALINGFRRNGRC